MPTTLSDAEVASMVAHSINSTVTSVCDFMRISHPTNTTDLVHQIIQIYTRPSSLLHVMASCISFLALMLVLCAAFEFTNPECGSTRQRWKQIQSEILESIPAVFSSTSIALAHMAYIYPLRWGIDAPILPSSMTAFMAESMYWMICFEVFVYALHRFLHWRRPIDMYTLIHGDHHVFRHPTAFASQAIHPIEAMLFSETSLIASIFLFPISIVTQYICGILLLTWSIAAHDSRFILDGGAHYEHHSHPTTNLGFLGIMDVLCGTVWWGYRYDGKPGIPSYVPKLQKLHVTVFGYAPSLSPGDTNKDE